jgi:hypothetical protein
MISIHIYAMPTYRRHCSNIIKTLIIFLPMSDFYNIREKEASETVRTLLEDLRFDAQKANWTFEVGYTTVLESDIRDITGLIVPDNL